MTTNDTEHWAKSVFSFRLGEDFQTYIQMLQHSLADETLSSDGKTPTLDPVVSQMLSQTGEQGYTPAFFSKNKCRDTSIGGNDAINCYYQYNETDDVTHPFLDTSHGSDGMGRVYSETIDDNQQLMHLTFGVPQFNDGGVFYKYAVESNLAKLMNTGETYDIKEIGYLVGATARGIVTTLTMPFIPNAWLAKWVNLTGTSMTKYYDFKSTMPLYYRCVNSILAHLMVNMGIMKDGNLINGKMPSSQNTNGGASATTPHERAIIESAETESQELPDIFSKWGPDIYRILCKKYMYMNGTYLGDIPSSDYTLVETMRSPEYKRMVNENKLKLADAFFTQMKNSIYEADRFISFRVERSTDSSESLSNETGESEISKFINSKMAQIRDLQFKFMEGNALGQTVHNIMEGVSGLFQGVTDSMVVENIASTMAGNGYIDIPEVWKNSSFNKSYSFNISLRSPYGDPHSIMQSIYIPLALLLAGALPRATGASSYTSPFICRAYCKGMFAVPLGIIDSIHIKRGSDQHGWNNDRLPTCVDVSFTIKDLSPAMFLSISDANNWTDVFGANSSFQEYLLTLSAVGTRERYSYLMNMRKKMAVCLTILHSKFSPFYLGNKMTDSAPGRVLSAIVPTSKVPLN